MVKKNLRERTGAREKAIIPKSLWSETNRIPATQNKKSNSD